MSQCMTQLQTSYMYTSQCIGYSITYQCKGSQWDLYIPKYFKCAINLNFFFHQIVKGVSIETYQLRRQHSHLVGSILKKCLQITLLITTHYCFYKHWRYETFAVISWNCIYWINTIQTYMYTLYKYRLLHNIFEDKKTRLDLILILLLCLGSLRMKNIWILVYIETYK